MWNYIYFALYLDYRDQNDHNALEKYIFEEVVDDGSIKDMIICYYPQLLP